MRFAEAAGLRVSSIGLGTWQFGSWEWGYGKDYSGREALLIVEKALDLGITLVDTAEVYGFGRSERILGRALAERRGEAVIATKIFPVMPAGPVVSNRARASARRLGVEAIDLYQVHWPNPVVPISATMAELAKLRDEGLVRYVGVSNFSLAGWQAAEKALGSPVVSNQVRYSLADRRPEKDLLGWAQANDRLIIAYSPLGQGLLSARYDADHRPGGLRATTKEFLPDNLTRADAMLQVLREVARNHDATPAQVALAWLISHPNVVAIPGASSVSQVESNAAAADLELSEAEVSELSAASSSYDPVGGPTGMAMRARAIGEDLLGRFGAFGQKPPRAS
jgi:aryl-alcohol dehydrogenase-like predicted oxidoreductase